MYTYDQLGNRRTKHDELNDVLTCYAYDTDFDPSSETWDPNVCFTPNDPLVLTRNNRLLEYREFGPESAGNRALLRTVRYWYDQYGLARHIVVKDEGYATYRDLNLTYTPSGQLWLALQQEWTYDSWSPNEQQVTILPAWEFRYDAPRQRYLARRWVWDVQLGKYVQPQGETGLWTDYLGDQPYVDYDVTDSGGTPTAGELQRYLAALGVHGEKDVVAQGTPETYYHPDLTGSTTVTSDELGAQSARTAYTAFGELVDANGTVGYDPLLAPPTRYQYDGSYGYESSLIMLYGANPNLPPITLQHVGARWYQPGIGRFVQRDPIGLSGGLSVYSYCANSPLTFADPYGLMPPGGGCPYCGKMYCHCHHDDPPSTGQPKPPTPPAPTIPPYGDFPSLPRPEPYPRNWLKSWLEDYLGPFGWPVNVCANWTRLWAMWSEHITLCFTGDTLVHTDDGPVPIACVAVGDVLASEDSAAMTDSSGPRVNSLHSGWTRCVVDIVLPTEVLRCTSNHPFWVEGSGWVDAGQLQAGDELKTITGSVLQVVDVDSIELPSPIPIYNLTVSDSHTYYVGSIGVLVHNKPR